MGLEIHQFFERHRPKRFRDIAGNVSFRPACMKSR